MLLYDSERRWGPWGICRPEDEGIFFAGGVQASRAPSETTADLWDQAKAICGRCPVMQECRRDTQGEEYGVWGGLDQHERYLIRKRLRRRAAKWSPELRLAWGEELHRLYKSGLKAEQVLRRTGIPSALMFELIRGWERHLAEQPPAAAIVDLHLPEPERAAIPPFPERPGRRHAWVRHVGRMSDAIYRGQTPSGSWILVTVHSGRGHVNKWVKPEDVQFYHPQPVVIINKYKEDEGSAGESAA